jgi:hypothetical protein
MDALPPPPDGSQSLPAAPAATTEPLGRAPSGAPPKRRRWPLLMMVVCAVLLVVGAIGAVVASTGDSSASSSPSAGAPSPTTPPPVTPTNVHATAGAFEVNLTWHAGTDGSSPTRYDIRRNGNFVGQAKGSATSFTDTDPVPGERYKYTVTAVGPDEQHSVASVTVTTKGAPPGTAALVGTFNVHLHNTSNSGPMPSRLIALFIVKAAEVTHARNRTPLEMPQVTH